MPDFESGTFNQAPPPLRTKKALKKNLYYDTKKGCLSQLKIRLDIYINPNRDVVREAHIVIRSIAVEGADCIFG